MTEQTTVVVGHVARPHGIRGAVLIELSTDEPERRFRPGGTVFGPDGSPLEITTSRWQGNRMLVTFAGCPDRDAAEALRGLELSARVALDETPSGDEEYFDRHLIGLRVLDQVDREIGVVKDVLHLPAQDVLEVQTASEVRMVPFVVALVPEVDLERGILRLMNVEGLLEDLE